ALVEEAEARASDTKAEVDVLFATGVGDGAFRVSTLQEEVRTFVRERQVELHTGLNTEADVVADHDRGSVVFTITFVVLDRGRNLGRTPSLIDAESRDDVRPGLVERVERTIII